MVGSIGPVSNRVRVSAGGGRTAALSVGRIMGAIIAENPHAAPDPATRCRVPEFASCTKIGGQFACIHRPHPARLIHARIQGSGRHRPLFLENTLSSHVYKHIELTGSSTKNIEDAISTAIAKAHQSVRNIQWFEVVETRGHVEKGKVAHWQVTIKIGFTLED
jgi:flavin-binding protein dodecin